MQKLAILLILLIALSRTQGKFLRVLQEEEEELSISEPTWPSEPSEPSEPSLESEFSSDLYSLEDSLESLSEISQPSEPSEVSEEDGEGVRRILSGRNDENNRRRPCKKGDGGNFDGESPCFEDGEAPSRKDRREKRKERSERKEMKKRECGQKLRGIFQTCKHDLQDPVCSLNEIEGKCLFIGCRIATRFDINFEKCEQK